LVWEAINNYHPSLSAIKETNQSHGGMQPNMQCQQQQLSDCLSGSVLFLFLTFPVIPSPNSSKGKKASCNCALGVVAVCARKNFDLDYVGTSSTNTGPRPTMVIVRGVQYMHWVMHKCIMVKVRGETKYT